MKHFHPLIVGLILFAPIACSVGCGSNEPINVMEGRSREELDAEAQSIYSEYEESAEQNEMPAPTAEERAMNAGR
ncbi:hypothetical protein SAMN06265222_12069 [Neorhodopirellula lusitana]|uniref:Secreted protein n=1 Tax=Neorhodopirellula lusitana TaxID=445327 RepID=A0ABY1QQP1_9BACT|nr:hypothetical protein [Neorhodopirellula lusitana]SMP76038.1 hypothetical protein SAMN06265222_12069 [Neorhodopirellula lusitana]